MEDKIITEADLLKIFGLKKSALNSLRYKGFPFVKVTSQCRVYLLSDIMAWAKNHRMRINNGSDATDSDE